MTVPAGHAERPDVRGWTGAIIGGIALGSGNSIANVFGSAYGPHPVSPGQGVLWLEYLSAWIGSAWAWALFAFVVGWFTRRRGTAVVRAVPGLVVAVAAYYLSDAALGGTNGAELNAMKVWAGIALVVAPVMALLGCVAQRLSWWGLPAGLAAPALMVFDTTTRPTGPDHIHPGSQWVVYSAAAGLAVALVVRAAYLATRRPARRTSPGPNTV